MKFDLGRFKNYGLWVSVAAALLMVLQAVGVPVVPEQYDIVVNSILTILVTLGIVSNPKTENKGFGDDKPKENATENATETENSEEDDIESKL